MPSMRRMFRTQDPLELARELKKTLDVFLKADPESKDFEKHSADMDKIFDQAYLLLFGEHEVKPRREVADAFLTALFELDVVQPIINNLELFSFEARKIASQVVCSAMKLEPQTRALFAANAALFKKLVDGYEQADIAIYCGQVLREALQHSHVLNRFLNSPHFFALIPFLHLPNFDVSSDAFSTFRAALTVSKKIVAHYLKKNFDAFFAQFHALIESSNYVTRRMSLKLLGELLLERYNYDVMLRYVESAENLKVAMRLLRDQYAAIQFEAFHVFKVFVANPNKTDAVKHLLVQNRRLLIEFLAHFQEDKEDEQFTQEKQLLLKEIRGLPAE
eukprot:gnl/Chilomastix_cuspidata/1367.p1 GENE.gnl/Chilomastix_cuspidata/1367~~gnl/Chilomastix_cuspidata/1367.p1  ORF type:complete len:333 (+),score=171.78 gnl/Chilomastix_cuspidata/1367:32-1030(+)